MITELKLFLTGKDKHLLGQIEQAMNTKAKALRFEEAAMLRDRLEKLRFFFEKQRVDTPYHHDFQLWATWEESGLHYLLIQTFIEGKLLYQRGIYEKSQGATTLEDLIQAVWFQLKPENQPSEILVDAVLAEKLPPIIAPKDTRLRIHCPQKGTKYQMVLGAQKNARLGILRLLKEASLTAGKNPLEALSALKKSLSLSQLPLRIYGIDISHLSGSGIVGSCVCFENGKPKKSDYRCFKIQSVTLTSHDPASIYEVVCRRLFRDIQSQTSLPNLLLIDGGIGQLSFAKKALALIQTENPIDIVSLAKKEEDIYVSIDSPPIRLPKTAPELHLLQAVRDEAHRFALTIQRKQRRIVFDQTRLHAIRGIGKKRIDLLFKTFGDIQTLSKSSPEAIAKMGNIGLSLAQKLLKALQDG